jgi:hypothetical protein
MASSAALALSLVSAPLRGRRGHACPPHAPHGDASVRCWCSVWSPTPVMPVRNSLRHAVRWVTSVTMSPMPSRGAVLATRTRPVPDRLCRWRRGHGALRSSSIAEIGQAGEVIGDDGELLLTFVLGTEHIAGPMGAIAVVERRTTYPETSAHPTPPRSELVGRHLFYGVPKSRRAGSFDHNEAGRQAAAHLSSRRLIETVRRG